MTDYELWKAFMYFNDTVDHSLDENHSPWSTWSECSTKCGPGQKERMRSCGSACKEVESMVCLNSACEGTCLSCVFCSQLSALSGHTVPSKCSWAICKIKKSRYPQNSSLSMQNKSFSTKMILVFKQYGLKTFRGA